MTSYEITTPGGYLSKKQVREYLGGISSTTLHDWQELRGFPRPVYVTSHRPLWLKSAVEDFMKSLSHGHARYQKAMTNAELALYHLDRAVFHCNLSKEFVNQHLGSDEAKVPGTGTTALNEKLKRIRLELDPTIEKLTTLEGQ